jgi:hypothetical protein
MVKVKKAEEVKEDKWQIEDDARTILRYAELVAKPERFEKAKKFIKEQQNALTKILKSKEG